MKIAIPISRFDSSGGIRVLSILANGLAGWGYQVSFVVPRGQHTPFFPLNSNVLTRVIEPDVGNYTLVSGLLKKFQLAFGVPADTDAAIANAFMTAYSVRISQMIGKTKRGLYFVQGYEPLAFGQYGHGSQWLKLLKTKMASATYGLGLECITNSTWTSNMIQKQYKKSAAVAPLGVDTDIFRPICTLEEKRAGSPIIMTIGNTNPVKRFDLFLLMMKELQSRIVSKALIATHDPALMEPSENLTRYASPKTDSELADLYNRATVFVSTSACEGFGLPLLEAMACGTPVVTTDSGGIRDFCINDFNCRIVKTDTPEWLADAVMEICSSPGLTNRLIENGLATARQWRWEKLIDSFDALLRA